MSNVNQWIGGKWFTKLNQGWWWRDVSRFLHSHGENADGSAHHAWLCQICVDVGQVGNIMQVVWLLDASASRQTKLQVSCHRIWCVLGSYLVVRQIQCISRVWGRHQSTSGSCQLGHFGTKNHACPQTCMLNKYATFCRDASKCMRAHTWITHFIVNSKYRNTCKFIQGKVPTTRDTT